jgi:hypothetical protein
MRALFALKKGWYAIVDHNLSPPHKLRTLRATNEARFERSLVKLSGIAPQASLSGPRGAV